MALLILKESDQPNTPPKKINQRWYYPYVRLSGSTIDLNLSAEGRYGSYFFSTNGGRSNHIFEFSAMHPVATSENGENHVYGRWLIGTLASDSKSGSFGASVAFATANASGSVKSNNFKGQTRGIEEKAYQLLRNLSGNLSADSISKLGSSLEQSISWCVDEANTGQSIPGSVYQLKDRDWNLKESVAFALGRIERGDSLIQANAFLDNKLSRARSRKDYLSIDPLTIAATFHRLGVEKDKIPTREQSKQARDLKKKRIPLPSPNQTASGYWLEVNPFRMEGDNSVPALHRLSNDPKRIVVNNWPIDYNDLSPSVGNFGGYSLDIQTALQVSASGLVDLDANLDAKFWGYGFESTYVADGLTGSLVLDEKYSVGFKVKVKTSDTDANLSVAALAAKATLGHDSFAYEIEGLGINLAEFNYLPSLASAASGKFDLNTLNTLGSLYQQASNAINDHTNPNFLPILSEVNLNLGAPEIQDLCEQGYNAFLGNQADYEKFIALVNHSNFEDLFSHELGFLLLGD